MFTGYTSFLWILFVGLPSVAQEPSRSKLPFQLVGTIIRAESAKSIATVRTTPLAPSDNYQENSNMKGLAIVTSIKREYLYFKNTKTGQLEYIRTAPYDPKFAPSSKLIDASGDQKEFQVSRCLVKSVLSDLPKFLQDAAMSPVTVKDQVIGFKFTWIKPESLYEKLGMKVGDIIQSVNNFPIRSPQDAVEIFQQLQNSSLVVFQITRDNRKHDLTYLIREETGKCS